ncbi:MAG: hypothetical protein ACRDP8_27125, partial [Actinopolymorphaceae bacterium]
VPGRAFELRKVVVQQGLGEHDPQRSLLVSQAGDDSRSASQTAIRAVWKPVPGDPLRPIAHH